MGVWFVAYDNNFLIIVNEEREMEYIIKIRRSTKKGKLCKNVGWTKVKGERKLLKRKARVLWKKGWVVVEVEKMRESGRKMIGEVSQKGRDVGYQKTRKN